MQSYRIAIGPQTWRKVYTLQTLPASDEPFDDGIGKVAGFSLHAGVAARETEAIWRAGRLDEESTQAERRDSMTWAQRLKRVSGIDMETCPACGGAVRIVACIEDPDVIETILGYLEEKSPGSVLVGLPPRQGATADGVVRLAQGIDEAGCAVVVRRG